jgi:hypothetical protein
METNTAQARRVINALKFGVIPDTNLELLCTGRESEMEEFEGCLDMISEGNGAVKFISGAYGSGKSFLLGIFDQMAVQKGFLTAKTVISKSFGLNSLENLYYNVMHNLSLSGSNAQGTGFEEIFDSWVNRLQSYTDKEKASEEIKNVISTLNNYNSSFARAFLVYIKAKTNRDTELSNAASSWIKGEKNIPAHLKARFDVKGDIDRQNSMDALKAFIRLINLLGYKGMVILIDELELLMNMRSDLRKSAYENLRYLVDSSGAGEFSNCLFVFAATEELFEDSEKGIRTYDALHQRIGNGLEKSSSSFLDKRRPVMNLTKLNMEDIQALTDKIVAVHLDAYNWTPKISNEAIRNWTLLEFKKAGNPIMPVNTRIYITKVIEILDIMEQNPDNKVYCSELRLVKKNGADMFVNSAWKTNDQ